MISAAIKTMRAIIERQSCQQTTATKQVRQPGEPPAQVVVATSCSSVHAITRRTPNTERFPKTTGLIRRQTRRSWRTIARQLRKNMLKLLIIWSHLLGFGQRGDKLDELTKSLCPRRPQGGSALQFHTHRVKARVCFYEAGCLRKVLAK